MMRHVLDSILVRVLARAQVRAASILIACRKPALGIHVHIAKMNVRAMIQPHRRRERRARPRHPIRVIIRNRNILRPFQLKRQRIRTLARLFLRLRRVHVPILHVVELDLVAHVVFVRKLVHMARRGRIGNVESRLRERHRRPDIRKRPSTAVRHPQARILPVPAPPQIGIGRMVVVIRIGAAPMPAQESHIVNQRIFPRAPHHPHRPRIEPARKHAEPAQDVPPALRREDHRARRTHAPKGRRVIRQIELRHRGVQPDQHRVRF